MDRDEFGRELVPCKYCGTPTAMIGTKLCDRCWELAKRVRFVNRELLLTILRSERDDEWA